MKIKYTKVLLLLLLSTCFGGTVVAQQKISVNLYNAPAVELFQFIERNSDCRVFFLQEEVEGVVVTINTSNKLPSELLKEALKDSDLRISEFGNDIFVLKNRYITTVLPESFFNDYLVATKVEYGAYQLNKKQGGRANSEFKQYEVGDPTSKSTQAKLSGYIHEYSSGKPLSGLRINIKGVYSTITTNSEGFYSITLPKGKHEINISGSGIKDSKRIIVLHSTGEFDIEVMERVISMEEIYVYSDKRSNVLQPIIGVERFVIKEIKNVPTPMGEGDIMRVVTMLPGVKSVGEVSSGFNVRGGSTDQNLILFNESTIYNPTHIFGLLSGFNPDLIDEMELYKSSIPAEYGGRISSVMVVNNREGNRDKYSASASVGVLTSRAMVEGPISKGKSSFILGGRMTYSDWILGLIPESSSYQGGKANFYDINGGLNFDLTPEDKVIVNGYYSHDKFSFDPQINYAYNNINTSLKWNRKMSDNLTASFSSGFDRYDHVTNIKDTLEPAKSGDLKFAINQIFAKANLSLKTSLRNTVKFGLHTQYYDMNPGTKHLTTLEETEILQKERALESALYISDQWEVTNKLTVDAGIRYSMFNVLGPRDYNVYHSDSLPSSESILNSYKDKKGIIKTYHGPEFRASLRYAFSQSTSVKAGVNSMRQYIHKVSNSSIMAPTDTWKLSDYNIKPQSGIQYALGLYNNLMENKIETSVEVYYKTMSDYLDYRPGANIVMNPNLEMEVVNTSGRAYGVELMLKKKVGKLNGWVSYTYSRTELRQKDKRISQPVNNGAWYPSDFDKPHEFKLMGNYKFTHRYSMSLNCEYSTGRPITLPIAKYYYGDDVYVVYSDRNEFRIPDYFRIDIAFNIEPRHKINALTHRTFTIGVYNATGRKNAHSVYYKKEGKVVEGYTLSVFGAPIPYASFSIKF